MSEMEEKTYKQTYSLDEDESDSESSVEVQYIQASDLPPDELERILARYKSALEPETGQQVAIHPVESDEDADNSTEAQENYTTVPTPSWLRVAYEEEEEDDDEAGGDTNEEHKPRTIVYKTTYGTSNEDQSGSEASHDEGSDEDSYSNGVTYKTIYKTFRTRDSSPEAAYNDDDPDYEPKEERIKRYKKKQRCVRELKLFAQGAHGSNVNQGSKIIKVEDRRETVVTSAEKKTWQQVLCSGTFEGANVKRTKNCIELQPAPGAGFIKIPVPVDNQQRVLNVYKKEWEDEPQFKDWIQPWLDDTMYAYCKFCKCKLMADKKNLKDHSKTKKHRKNVYDATGVWEGPTSEPVNLKSLMPRARTRTEQIFLNNYDENFASSPEFNVRNINDPLLPIS